MADQLGDADEEDGGKIISHILGSNQSQVTQDLSAQTGLDSSQISQVLAIMAPALMSGVSNAASTTAAAGNTGASQSGGASPLSMLAGSGIFGKLFGRDSAANAQARPAGDPGLDGSDLLQLLMKAAK